MSEMENDRSQRVHMDFPPLFATRTGENEPEFDDVFFSAGYTVGERSRKLFPGLIALREDFLRLTVSVVKMDLPPLYNHTQLEQRMRVLIAHFVQGAPCTGEQILEGFYSKAAASLKQDIELHVRLEEVQLGIDREGRVPQIKNGFPNTGKMYGFMNKLAHPCNETLLDQHILAEYEGNSYISLLPILRPHTCERFYEAHCWLCYVFCFRTLCMLVSGLEEPTDEILRSISDFDRLEEELVRIAHVVRQESRERPAAVRQGAPHLRTSSPS